MSVESAIAQLEVEIGAFKHGTKDQPKENTGAWFMLRALSAGLTMLKTMQQLHKDGDPSAAEAFFRTYTGEMKTSVHAEQGEVQSAV